MSSSSLMDSLKRFAMVDEESRIREIKIPPFLILMTIIQAMYGLSLIVIAKMRWEGLVLMVLTTIELRIIMELFGEDPKTKKGKR